MALDRRGSGRAVGIVLALLAAGAVLGTAWKLGDELRDRPEPRSASAPPLATPPVAAPLAPASTALGSLLPRPVEPQSAPSSVPPSFDVVRVAPSGVAVLAGRAAPGDEVTIRDAGQVVGTAQADRQGEWVVVAPIDPGVRELTLDAAGPGGRKEAEASLVLGRPLPDAALAAGAAASGGQTGPAPATDIAVLLPRSADAAPRLLRSADPSPAMLDRVAAPAAGAQRLSIEVVDYDAEGDVLFAGLAPPGSRLRLYVGDTHAGDVIAGADGRWVLRPTAEIRPGRHEVRIDRLTESGRVLARAAIPFLREARERQPAAAQPGLGQTVVQPGQTLWRISRQTYGRGVRYTVIYQANRDQIRDPARIYPGQVFALPAGEPPASR